MEKVDETDLLRLQNLSLKAELAKRDLDAFGAYLNQKYNAPDGLRVADDGTILGAPLKAVAP